MIDKGPNFFLYRHVRIDKNEPFYIGVGRKYIKSKFRGYARAFNISTRNKIWNDIVNKTKYEVEIMLESDDLDYIFNKEIEFIKLYGRINKQTGTLCNLTDGGIGCKNAVQSKRKTYKLKSTISRKGRIISDNTKRLMSDSSKTKRKVVKMNLQGDILDIYDSLKSVTKDGFTNTNVGDCCKGKKATHKNFKWAYYDNK